MKNILLPLLLLVATIAFGQQKFGHLNTGNVLELMPDTKEANTQLLIFQKELTARGETMARMLEDKIVRYNNDAPNMSANDRQARETVLRGEQQELAAFSEEAKARLDGKRSELLKPIILKVRDAVKAVALENKYNYIFDVSSGNMLYVNDSEDVVAMVKKKLNIQ
jgi:outer membrane protein